MGKEDNMQEEMGNAHKEMEIQKKQLNRNGRNQKEMQAFDGLISRLDIAKETISLLEGKSTETSQNWNGNGNGKYKSEKRNAE